MTEQEKKEKGILVELVAINPKTQKPILDAEGKEIKTSMSVYAANKYYATEGKRPSTTSLFIPVENQSYVYDKAQNKLVEAPVNGKTAKKANEPVV